MFARLYKDFRRNTVAVLTSGVVETSLRWPELLSVSTPVSTPEVPMLPEGVEDRGEALALDGRLLFVCDNTSSSSP